MKSEEVSKLVYMVLADCKDPEAVPAGQKVELWSAVFRNVPYEIGVQAALLCLRRSPDFPTISCMYEAVKELTPQRTPAPGDDEAWRNVLDEIRRCGTYMAPAFMHPLIDLVVRRFGWLELCMSGEDSTDVRARFCKEYNALRRRYFFNPELEHEGGDKACTRA